MAAAASSSGVSGGLTDLGDGDKWQRAIKEARAKAKPPSAWTPLVEGKAQAKKNQAPPSYLALLSMDGKRKGAQPPNILHPPLSSLVPCL